MRYLALLTALGLFAQLSTASAKALTAAEMEGSDSKAPLKVSAAEMVTDKKGGKITFSGNVEAVKGKLAISAEEMTVWTGKDQKEFDKIVAKGNVVITREDKTAAGDVAEYFNESEANGQEERIEIRGNASLKDGRNSASGKMVIYFFKTEDMKIYGDQSKPSVVTFFPQDSRPPAPVKDNPPPQSEQKAPERTEPSQHRYSVQAASFPHRKDAERMKAGLEAKGYRAVITEANVKGGLWHRVRLEGFDSLEDAQDTAERLRLDFGLKPMVVSHNE